MASSSSSPLLSLPTELLSQIVYCLSGDNAALLSLSLTSKGLSTLARPVQFRRFRFNSNVHPRILHFVKALSDGSHDARAILSHLQEVELGQFHEVETDEDLFKSFFADDPSLSFDDPFHGQENRMLGGCTDFGDFGYYTWGIRRLNHAIFNILASDSIRDFESMWCKSSILLESTFFAFLFNLPRLRHLALSCVQIDPLFALDKLPLLAKSLQAPRQSRHSLPFLRSLTLTYLHIPHDPAGQMAYMVNQHDTNYPDEIVNPYWKSKIYSSFFSNLLYCFRDSLELLDWQLAIGLRGLTEFETDIRLCWDAPVTFPCLKHMSYSMRPMWPGNLLLFDMPKLERLSICTLPDIPSKTPPSPSYFKPARYPKLQTLAVDPNCAHSDTPLSPGQTDYLTSLLRQNLHISTFAIGSCPREVMDNRIIPILCRPNVLVNIRSLALSWNQCETDVEHGGVKATSASLEAVGKLRSLERLCLTCATTGFSSEWRIDHDEMRRHLRDLVKLRYLAFVSDTPVFSHDGDDDDGASGTGETGLETRPHEEEEGDDDENEEEDQGVGLGDDESEIDFSWFGDEDSVLYDQYYDIRQLTPAIRKAANARPELDAACGDSIRRVDDTLRSPETEQHERNEQEEQRKERETVFFRGHRNLMLDESERYAAALPSLEWMWMGQVEMRIISSEQISAQDCDKKDKEGVAEDGESSLAPGTGEQPRGRGRGRVAIPVEFYDHKFRMRAPLAIFHLGHSEWSLPYI
ncbi:hypothetical protein MKZ38_009468 [Zalerion maritima]|uniref:F-box domain-containing protein n=1 Tax=Zalerion maritima TaxID=339359 RepID=A0AAD5RTG1_9PEZI|nr:hypothetical protein MKZ38_009468 [Zalerion maritima]